MKCPKCQRDIQPVKKFNWVIFIIGVLLFGIPGFLYLIYYWAKNPKYCPACGKKVY